MLWRPSVVAHFTLKFDESLQIQPDYDVISTDSLVKKGGGKGRAVSNESDRPLVVTKGRDSFVLNRVPMEASIELPGIRQAGTFSCKMDFSELPIDPRTVRAAAIEIHIGAIDADAFARGVSRPVAPNGIRESILDTQSPETRVLTAMVDKWSVNHSGSSSIISMSGRDLRGALLDTPLSADPKVASQILDQLNLNQPIDELIAQILRYHPAYEQARFSVAIAPSEWGKKGPPRVGDPSIIPRVKKGAKGKKSQAHTAADSHKMSFWDLIVQFCYYAGAVPLMNGADIVIRPIHRLYDQQNAGIDPGIRTPFRNGNVREIDAQSGQSISPLRVRKLVYGRDIETLEIERNFGGYNRPKVVRVISHDPSSTEQAEDKTITVWYPPLDDKPPRKTSKTPGQEQPHEEILTIDATGYRDREVLQNIAKGIYNEIGRGEVGGNIVTKNLASFGGDNADPDLLRIRTGDAVELGVDTRTLRPVSPLVSEYTDHMRVPFDQRVKQLTDILGDQNLAQVVVATSRGQVQQLQRFFRVSGVKYNWNSTTGIKIDFDFQNYIEVRHNAKENDRPPANNVLKKTVV